MSDTPLFQNSDEQEAVYGGAPRADSTDDDAAAGVVPPGLMGAGLLGAGGSTGLTGIPAPATAPEVRTDTTADPDIPDRT